MGSDSIVVLKRRVITGHWTNGQHDRSCGRGRVSLAQSAGVCGFCDVLGHSSDTGTDTFWRQRVGYVCETVISPDLL